MKKLNKFGQNYIGPYITKEAWRHEAYQLTDGTEKANSISHRISNKKILKREVYENFFCMHESVDENVTGVGNRGITNAKAIRCTKVGYVYMGYCG